MNKKGFTLVEMVFCISVILIILLLVIPNVTSKNAIVKGMNLQESATTMERNMQIGGHKSGTT